VIVGVKVAVGVKVGVGVGVGNVGWHRASAWYSRPSLYSAVTCRRLYGPVNEFSKTSVVVAGCSPGGTGTLGSRV
jgi:hypothetical protein